MIHDSFHVLRQDDRGPGQQQTLNISVLYLYRYGIVEIAVAS